jgi:hypothetical protein
MFEVWLAAELLAVWGKEQQQLQDEAVSTINSQNLLPVHVAGILLACKDKSASSSSLKIEALTFLRAAMESNAPAVFQPHVAQLSSGVFAAVGERYYKVQYVTQCGILEQ